MQPTTMNPKTQTLNMKENCASKIKGLERTVVTRDFQSTLMTLMRTLKIQTTTTPTVVRTWRKANTTKNGTVRQQIKKCARVEARRRTTAITQVHATQHANFEGGVLLEEATTTIDGTAADPLRSGTEGTEGTDRAAAHHGTGGCLRTREGTDRAAAHQFTEGCLRTRGTKKESEIGNDGGRTGATMKIGTIGGGIMMTVWRDLGAVAISGW